MNCTRCGLKIEDESSGVITVHLTAEHCVMALQNRILALQAKPERWPRIRTYLETIYHSDPDKGFANEVSQMTEALMKAVALLEKGLSRTGQTGINAIFEVEDYQKEMKAWLQDYK